MSRPTFSNTYLDFTRDIVKGFAGASSENKMIGSKTFRHNQLDKSSTYGWETSTLGIIGD